MKKSLTIICLLAMAFVTNAKVILPSMFQDGMVLQRNQPIRVWGTASPLEHFTITMGKMKLAVEAGTDGRWNVALPAMKAGGPYVLEVGDRTISDVLVGDVWLCAGQSNMDLMVSRVYPQYLGVIDDYKNDHIRLLRVEQRSYVDGQLHDITTNGWRRANRQDAWNFSALGYFLARRMYEKTGVPQGIICNSWGGTPIEAWVPRDSLVNDYPGYCNKTAIYTPEYVESQQKANSAMNNSWQRTLDASDPGMSQGWGGSEADDSQWLVANQYADNWAKVQGRGVVGSVWMRQHVFIDSAHAGRSALLNLGTLYDMDYTYVNGRQVGVTYYQYPPRRYQIPEGLLHEGDNVIAIRFINKQGVPAFTHGKKYQLEFAADDVLPLKETWLSHIGSVMPACPSQDVSTQYLPYILYQSMFAPLVPYNVAGVVWYQGESNTDRPQEYLPMLRKLKGAWREALGQPALPFVIVQLANFMAPSEGPQESGWAALREAQRLSTLEDAHSELAVTIDLGEWNDIHPLRKLEVADRVALALRKVCRGELVNLSPVVTEVGWHDGEVVLTFDQKLKEGALHEFELAGADGRFVNAEAVAKGRQVVVHSDQVNAPVRLRYAWKNNPAHADCYGINGLPVSPAQFQKTAE